MDRGPLGPGSRGRDDRRRTRSQAGPSDVAGRGAVDEKDTGEAEPGPSRERVHAGRPMVIASIHKDTWELKELARTLGLHLVFEVWQNRNRPHPGTFLGRGKLEQLKGWLEEWKAGVVPREWEWTGSHWVPERPDEVGQREEREGTSWGGWTGSPRDKVRGEGDRRDGNQGEENGGEQSPQGQKRPPDPDAFDGRDLLVILDEDVRPAVLFNLEERLGVEVWGRTRLILEIFSQHAHLREARLQVELAQLRYDVPLVHEAIHRKRKGERPGFMGGGEYAVADYEDFIKRRMRTIRDELERVRHDRAVRRKQRRGRFYLVSLAGYTNAGKSSLLSALTGAPSLRESALFSTLGTMTRRLDRTGRDRQADREETREQDRLKGDEVHGAAGPDGGERVEGADRVDRAEGDSAGGGLDEVGESDAMGGEEEGGSGDGAPLVSYRRPILVTDTVGFIRALPSWLVEAFHATLEEIALADVVLLVADVSDPEQTLLDKVQVGLNELAHLDVTCPILLVLNKTDLVDDQELKRKKDLLVQESIARHDWIVGVSANREEGLGRLIRSVQENLPGLVEYRLLVDGVESGQRLLHRLRGWGEIIGVDYAPRLQVHGYCDPIHWKDLQREIGQVEGKLERLG